MELDACGSANGVLDPRAGDPNADAVAVATNLCTAGIESEFMWHVAQQIKSKNGAPVRRVLFHEITRDAVQLAIQNAGEIDERKVDAQQARRVLDRLVGYKASPVLWKTVKKGLSAGRVQTVALRLIVEREREIRAFKPVEYFTAVAFWYLVLTTIWSVIQAQIERKLSVSERGEEPTFRERV